MVDYHLVPASANGGSPSKARQAQETETDEDRGYSTSDVKSYISMRIIANNAHRQLYHASISLELPEFS